MKWINSDLYERAVEHKPDDEEERSKSQIVEVLSQFGRDCNASNERPRNGQVQFNKDY